MIRFKNEINILPIYLYVNPVIQNCRVKLSTTTYITPIIYKKPALNKNMKLKIENYPIEQFLCYWHDNLLSMR